MRPRGTTLPELLIVMGIMGVLLYGASQLVVHGYEFYRDTDRAIQVQRETLLAMTRITTDLYASHHLSIDIDNSVPAQHQLVFPVPSDLDGRSEVNPEGMLFWKSILGYGLEATPEGHKNLMKYGADMLDFHSPPYPINSETVLMPPLSGLAAAPSARSRVAARNIEEFEVGLGADTVDIKVTALLVGRLRAGSPMDDSITLETKAFPKN